MEVKCKKEKEKQRIAKNIENPCFYLIGDHNVTGKFQASLVDLEDWEP